MPFPLPEIPSLVLSSHLSWSLLLRWSLKSLLEPSQRFLISSEWNQCGLRCKKPDVKRLSSSLCHWYPDPSTPNPGTLDLAPSLNTLCTFLIPGLRSSCSLCLGSSVLFTHLFSLWQTPTYQGSAQASPPLGGYSRSSAWGETLSSGSQEHQSPLATLLVKHWAWCIRIYICWMEGQTTQWIATHTYPLWCFPCSSVGKESICDAGGLSSIPGSGRSPGEGNGNPLRYSCPENPDGQRSQAGYSAWGRKSQTQLSN